MRAAVLVRQATVIRCVFQHGLYPPVRLGKPGLVRPRVRPPRSERVRRIVPRRMVCSDIEWTGAGSTTAEHRERRKEQLLRHHDFGGSCRRLGGIGVER